MFSFSVSRRAVWITALIVLVSAIWLVREDQAQAGGVPPGEGIDVVYVAVSTNFPDSLGVGPGAGVNAGPILLVPTDPPIPGFTQAELIRLDPKKVVIVGGTAVVSSAMQTAIQSLLPNATVERLAGSNRYETNTLLTQSVYPVESWASIHPSAFTANDAGDVSLLAASNDVLYASIQLPQGATILEVKATLVDEFNPGDVVLDLFRVDSAAETSESIAGLSTAGLGQPGLTTLTTTSIASGLQIVNNEDFSYVVRVTGASVSDLMEIRNVMVRYRLGTPGA